MLLQPSTFLSWNNILFFHLCEKMKLMTYQWDLSFTDFPSGGVSGFFIQHIFIECAWHAKCYLTQPVGDIMTQ